MEDLYLVLAFLLLVVVLLINDHMYTYEEKEGFRVSRYGAYWPYRYGYGSGYGGYGWYGRGWYGGLYGLPYGYTYDPYYDGGW
jgi:hypothetical protein